MPGLPGYSLILPEHVWGEMSAKEIKEFKNYPDPVVSGPFNLTQWKQGEYWTMTSRPDYWQGAPTIDEIVFRNYNSNESVVQALLKGAIDSHGDPHVRPVSSRAGPARDQHGGNERRGVLAALLQRGRRPGEHREPGRARS